MSKTFLSVAGAVALLALAGCGAQSTATGPGTTVSPAAASSPSSPATTPESASAGPANTSAQEATDPAIAAGPKTSERGNLIKKPGDRAGITNRDGGAMIDFTVHSIKLDPKCTGEFADRAENGHFLVLDVSVETKKLEPDYYPGDWGMSAFSFKTIAPNGTTSNVDLGTGAAYSCMDDKDLLPQMIGSAEKARGMVVLDVENPKGTLVFEEPFAQAGWEWEYPAK